MIQIGGDKGLRTVFGKTNALKKQLKTSVDVHSMQTESASNDVYDLLDTIERLEKQKEERMGDLNASKKSLSVSKDKQLQLDVLVEEFTTRLEELL